MRTEPKFFALITKVGLERFIHKREKVNPSVEIYQISKDG
jgi:hypothetical protein